MLDLALLESCLAPFDIALSGAVYERLEVYAELLTETNRQFNLTAITEPQAMTVKHFADCLALLGLTKISEGAACIDVGTGAGFPGLVLKLARPDLQMTFLDSTRKKLHFIEGVLSAVGLDGEIVHLRAEQAGQMPQYREKFDFVTARAVSDLRNLAEYCLPFLRVGGEIAEDRTYLLTAEMPRRLVTVKKISQTPPKYPRPSAKIAKNPLI